jgi:A/G-specific adenine glycosylase
MRAKASQPDIEDLIKSEDHDAAVRRPAAFSAQHDAARHDFASAELLATRTELLAWYDAHRRKLPWRGDPPPYLTTATHTSEKKKSKQAAAAESKKTGMDAFLKKEVEQVQEEVVKEEQAGAAAAVDDSEAKPRKVAPYETWVSEIMLQQTRVDTVVGYFLRWIDKFPTVAALAEANEEVRCGRT